MSPCAVPDTPISRFLFMGYDRLHAELVRLLDAARETSISFAAMTQLEILPAIEALRELTAQPGRRIPDPNKPSFSDALYSLGLTPEVVRTWRRRTAADEAIQDILALGGKKPNGKAAQRAKQATAVKHLARLVETVLSGDESRAERLAMALNDLYGGFPLS
jgi:hypothetical protein